MGSDSSISLGGGRRHPGLQHRIRPPVISVILFSLFVYGCLLAPFCGVGRESRVVSSGTSLTPMRVRINPCHRSRLTGKRFRTYAAKRSKKNPPPDFSDNPDLWNFTAEEPENEEMIFPDPWETIFPRMTPEQLGYIKKPEDLWDPGIYKLPEKPEIEYDYFAEAEDDNEDIELVRGRIRGNETHPNMWWEDSGFICVINLLADGMDPRPWEESFNRELGYIKKRGWLCVNDTSPSLNERQVARLVGFESIRDAKRVREIISRHVGTRLRQPFLEYVSPDKFKEAALETEEIQGAVTVIQTPFFVNYGSKGWDEIEAQILQHPKDIVKKKVRDEANVTLDPWEYFHTPWETEKQHVKEYLEFLERAAKGKLKSVEDIMDDSREVGGK